MNSQNVISVAVTGGPCGGKTTVLSYLYEELEKRGYTVLIVPEAATFLKQSGIAPGVMGMTAREFQEMIITHTIAWHDERLKIARKFGNGKVVILCDRGICDGLAYCDKSEFLELFKGLGLDVYKERDVRYQLVIHLVTAASGAEQFYTLGNNSARSESANEARNLDMKTRLAWHGCSHLTIIQNVDSDTGAQISFDEKKRRVLEATSRVVGFPEPLEVERKFLLKSQPDLSLLPPHVVVRIEQFYVRSADGTTVRYRKRGQEGSSWVYFRTTKVQTGTRGIRNETETIIGERDFKEAMRLRSVPYNYLIKDRYCFSVNGHYFELDRFIQPRLRVGWMLEVETTSLESVIHTPEGIDIGNDVTGQPEFDNEYLANFP